MLVRRPVRAFLGLAVSVMLLSACQQPTKAGDATAEAVEIQEIPKPSEYMDTNLPENAPTYLVGTMGSYAPMEFRDEYGQSIGFDMDIIYAIAARQKFHINVLTHPWDGILHTLNTGERDIIISSVNLTPEREEVYQFSQPYFALQDVLLVKTTNDKIHSFEDLVANKSKVSTLKGSAQQTNIMQLGVTENNVIPSDSQFIALKAMFADSSEAVIGDGPVMDYYALSYPEVPTKRLTLPDAPTQYFGIAVKKGNYELRDKLNAGLKQIHEEGIYDRIYFKWFHKPVPKDFLPWANG
ncbi:family 3 bacterial extracellular solute-binding protein [Vitreoscilla sp. C1]|uniref:transporter substrate-binding domain-containing protein n=1 Tax=Vitreoscilla sp. (strain C1) TaxID=96942 RepID=UPI000CDC7957|nr:transporter substrate-binding domain-containing protein [Vitreoscilla sp. C1]AUZ06420.1 family 3 bacterial extracellular solute-binding protein [Vitreoscilla sp. C1]